MENRILLIDGYSILHRAFYGLPILTNSKGVFTNAVYGFLNIIFKVMDDIQPNHIAVAFDLAAPTFRHKIFDMYKGTRKPMPEELKSQVPIIKAVLSAMNIEFLEKKGFEADDLIGTSAKISEKEGMTVYILSGDRDLLQLVTDKTTLILPKTGRGGTTVEMFTPERVEEVYQVTPDQIIDLKAMMGDPSDNIPGLPGVGEKTAVNLIKAYGSLENTKAHAEEIKLKKPREAFLEHYELGEMSKVLATIKCDVPVDFDPANLDIKNFYNQKSYELFKELEFKNYLSRFEETEKASAKDVQIQETEDLSEAEGLFERAKTEAFGFYLDVRDEEIKGLALSFDKETYYIKAEGFITGSYLCERAAGVLEISKEASTYRFKEQQNLIRSPYNKELFDCIIAAYLLDPLRSEYSYDHIAQEYANATLKSFDEIVGEKITKKTVITEEAYICACGYTAFTALKAKTELKNRLESEGMYDLFRDIEMPFAYTLSDMECEGIKMNADKLHEFSIQLKEQMDVLEKKIYEQAGEEFNIQSPKQLGVILFEKLGLPGGKKTKSGYSTAVDVLEKLKDDAPIVNDVLTFRQLAKLKSTYADSLSDYVKADGRIHSHFMQTITATGRISSVDPNLQNIPIRLKLGRNIRKVFIPEEGCLFIDADYSQIELRVLAHLSGDEKLIEAYNKDSDIHRITASEVFNVPLNEVTPLQRRNAKAVNFGIVYGISSFGLSQDLSISRKEAQAYIEKYFITYPAIKDYLDNAVKDAKENGYTTTMFGRRRPIPELKSSNFMTRSFGERVAMNSPIQGSAADIIKIAMNNVHDRLKKEGLKSRLILQVHDELLIEAPVDEVEKSSAILKEEMEKAAALRVKLEVDLNTGSNWDEAH